MPANEPIPIKAIKEARAALSAEVTNSLTSLKELKFPPSTREKIEKKVARQQGHLVDLCNWLKEIEQ